MAGLKEKIKSLNNKWWFVLAAVFLLLILVGTLVGWKQAYAEKFYPGLTLGNINLTGLRPEEVKTELEKIYTKVQDQGLIFKTSDKEVSISPVTLSTSPDLANNIFDIDINKTVDQAYATSRSNNIFTDHLLFIQHVILGQRAQVVYGLNKNILTQELQANFSSDETKPINVGLKINNGQVELIDEESGRIYDYTYAVAQLENNIQNLDFRPVELELKFVEPDIKKDDVASAVNSVENILKISELKLVYEDDSWSIDQKTIISWLEFQKQNDVVTIGANQKLVEEFLQPIAKEVDVPMADAKFKLIGNKVSEFQASQDGKTLNISSSYQAINQGIMLGQTADIVLIVDIVPAKVANKELNDLGVEELLGRGTSNFSGSPVNRRHNIKTGMEALNGILIAPGEEFSLLDALGEIDGANGYLQELVIKGSRTIPEYGGGLCQIGSTTFRAALWSGLPITAGHNHSYRVRYYEPAGMDATIYDPAPDMKFLNDTTHHVLFTAKMVGDDLFFEFYGTPDGRKVTISPNPPAIYNITSPGPVKYIETDTLAPGVKKKVESSHAGADTYFKYTVEYPNGEIKEQEFYSHYISWPEVWMVGRAATASTTEELPIDATVPETIPVPPAAIPVN